MIKWLEINQENLHTKFSALNADFSSPSAKDLGSRTPAQEGVKYGYHRKVVILTVLARLACKQLQLGKDILFIITSTSDELFNVSTLMTLSDFESTK